MESTAQYWRPVWEALEQHWRPRRRAREGAIAPVGHPSSRPSAIESGRRRAQTGLPGCRTVGEAPGRPGADLELCARRRAAALADRDAAQVPGHAQPRAAPQPIGIAARGSAHQAVQPRLGSAGHQRTTHAAGARRRRDRSCHPGGAGRPALARDGGSIMRRLQCVHDAASGLPTAAEAHAGGTATDRGSPRPTRSTDGRTCSRNITRRCSASPKSPGWAWIPRSRSSRKSARPRRRFLHRSTSPRGWAPAPATRRVRASTTVTAAPKATARCGASSIRPPMPPSRPRGRSSPSCIAASSHASAMPRPSARSRTGCVG